VIIAEYVSGAIYVEPRGLVELELRSRLSPIHGFIAAEFFVRPRNPEHVVSSIDASNNGRGFAATLLRQVNPGGRPTVFADHNESMLPSDRVLSDSQFTFVSSELILVPGAQQESTTVLRAAFTGFSPIASSPTGSPFAQLVLPWTASGEFSGVFAVRPVGGGAPQAAEFSGVPFGLGAAPADFDRNGVVDGGDLMIWQRSTGATGLEPFAAGDADGDGEVGANDLAQWASAYGWTPATANASSLVPEPAALAACCPPLIVIWLMAQSRTALARVEPHATPLYVR
jgi:hypothetical protein